MMARLRLREAGLAACYPRALLSIALAGALCQAVPEEVLGHAPRSARISGLEVNACSWDVKDC